MRKRARIKRFFDERGFGFLIRPGEPDLFFHINDVRDVQDMNDLSGGRQVEYEIGTDKGGRELAKDVVLL